MMVSNEYLPLRDTNCGPGDLKSFESLYLKYSTSKN
jgi:hypothetical protein